MNRLPACLAVAFVLIAAGCGGGESDRSSSSGIKVKLLSAEWEGTPSGQVWLIDDERLTVAEDLATLKIAIEIKNSSGEDRPVWPGGFVLSDGDGKSIAFDTVSLDPEGEIRLPDFAPIGAGETGTLYLEDVQNHELARNIEHPGLEYSDDDWRLDLPRAPDHDTLLNGQPCFHSYQARIVEQKWVGVSSADTGLRSEELGGNIRIREDLAGIEAVIEIENVDVIPVLVHGFIDLQRMVSRTPGSDRGISAIAWSVPVAEMALSIESESRKGLREIENPMQELKPGEKATFALRSSMVSYRELANAGVLAIRNLVDGWQLRLEPVPDADTLFGRSEPAPADAFAFSVDAVDWQAVPEGTTVEALGETMTWPQDSATATIRVAVRNHSDVAQSLGAGFRLIDSRDNPYPSVTAFLDATNEPFPETLELQPGDAVGIRLESILVSYDELEFAAPFSLRHVDYPRFAHPVTLPEQQALFEN